MYDIKFIDLFSGIGGFRIGLEKSGFKCVFSADIDKHACEVYKENFGYDPYCDITTLDPIKIPDFDLLCAGFPCQSFSISGKQKGFYDTTRGTLFFDICRILKIKKPVAFILENVQNLEKHDKGNTLRIMIDSLHELGYTVNYDILNANDFNTPQNRERIIIIGNRKGLHFDFNKIKKNKVNAMKDYLDKDGEFEYLDKKDYTIIKNYKRQLKSGLIFIGYRNRNIRVNGVRPNTEHLSRVHKQPNRIYSSEGTHPTLSSQETSGRYWIYHEDKVRKLTLNECFKFMGFPSDFKKVGLKSKLYQRIGNSICVNMVYAIGIEVFNQLFIREVEELNKLDPNQFLEDIYSKSYSKSMEDLSDFKLVFDEEQLNWINLIVSKEETFKGVYTVLISSLTYKCINPSQDIRYHKVELNNGYSGRSFDTKYVTPFLKSKRFFGAMKESGWLTRSLEQAHPFTLDFPGKIKDINLKSAFLNIINDIEENKVNPIDYLFVIFTLSIIEKSKKVVTLVNPITSESKLNIDQIIDYLRKHFYYKYSTRGASILPVIAFYSIYECLIKEMERFKNKKLDSLSSHTSSDKSSGLTGDIVIRDKYTNDIYEVIEIKFDIAPTLIMVEDVYEKFKTKSVQRYYILSTVYPNKEEEYKIKDKKISIRNEHGCQLIVNGIFKTLEYYLRLLENTDIFIDKYLKNLMENTELDFEHKIAWNKVLD